MNHFHSDFVELPDGTLAGLGADIRDVDADRRFVGDTIVELAPDGTERVIWTVWDWVAPDLSETWPTGFDPYDPGAEDWSHVNSIAWVDEENAYYVTALHLDAVFRVDRATGTTTWILSPQLGGDWEVEQPNLVYAPHSIEPLADGSFLVFNHGDKGHDECSNARRFTLDEATGQAVEQWYYETEDCVQVTFLGNAHPASDGSTLVSFTTAGRLVRTSEEATTLQAIQVEEGWGTCYVEPVDRLGVVP